MYQEIKLYNAEHKTKWTFINHEINQKLQMKRESSWKQIHSYQQNTVHIHQITQ